MNNKYTGEVEIRLAEKNYTLVFDLRACAALQSQFGNDILKNISSLSISNMIEVLVIGLNRHHPDITENFILDSSPPINQITDWVLEAMIYAHHGPESGRKIVEDLKTTGEEIQKRLLPVGDTPEKKTD